MNRTKTDMISKADLEKEEQRLRQIARSLNDSINDLEGIAKTEIRVQIIEYLVDNKNN